MLPHCGKQLSYVHIYTNNLAVLQLNKLFGRAYLVNNSIIINIQSIRGMEEEFFSVLLPDVKKELRRGIIESQKRGLWQNAKWLAELHHGLADTNIDSGDESQKDKTFCEAQLEGISVEDYDAYFLAKSYFDVREYDRAAHAVSRCESPVPRFLHHYATYMGHEKQRLDSTADQSNLHESSHVRGLSELLATLRAEHARSRLDGYGMFLYGIVLKTLDLSQAAQQMFLYAVRLVPTLWSAYQELAPLITEKEKLMALQLGSHWMRHFFRAHTYLELYLNDEGLKIYEDLQTVGFQKCVYLTAQMALAYHNKRDVDKAIEVFQTLQETDPYRLDNMDIYSNLLFVKEQKTEMAQLAHKAVSINKYRPETCCVIGNYYSIRNDHQMAITYFQRALKLNPKYLAAWTLMGHEFMELKNTNAAIQSYRKAVEVNKRDYRAWYGLGQAYEILKMHYYSLYYFKIAHQLRPYDSRMLVALGESYEKLDKTKNAVKCYWKACDVGDIEGIAMYKLASLHERLGDDESAVHCYMLYCEDDRATTDKQSLFHGYITLANYYEGKGDLDRAAHYAYKCLESDDSKNEAKSLLKTIENKRSEALDKNKQNIADADTTFEDDMELEESSDTRFANSNEFSLKSTRSATPLISNSNEPTQAALQKRVTAQSTSNSMNISEGDSLLNTPLAKSGDSSGAVEETTPTAAATDAATVTTTAAAMDAPATSTSVSNLGESQANETMETSTVFID